MKEEKRTTKVLTGTFTVTFHGDYIDAGDCAQYLENWLDAGLNDREDLRAWKFQVVTVTELHGDPEGYDN